MGRLGIRRFWARTVAAESEGRAHLWTNRRGPERAEKGSANQMSRGVWSAPALPALFERLNPSESGSELRALQTLRDNSPQAANDAGYRNAGLPDRLLSLYNLDSSVVLVTTYPKRQNRTDEDSRGVSSYVENLAPELSVHLARTGRRLVIVAEKRPGEEPVYEQGRVLVLRCWERNAWNCFFEIFQLLRRRLRRPKNILIQFEFNLFGDAAVTGLFPLFLLMLRLCGKRPVVMMHQVLDDLAEIRTHAGLESKPALFHLFRRLLPVFYWSLMRTASSVAVHEAGMKDVLQKYCRKPVQGIPHGCRLIEFRPSRLECRDALGIADRETVLLCFGFVAYYKGSDWIIHEMADHARQSPNTPLRLVLAGGKSPNQGGKPHYEQFFGEVLAAAARFPKHIQVTGYVPQERVPLYFAAADLAVFPYRTHMSASGPLAIACSFGCPFLFSSALRGVSANEDFSRTLDEAGLSVEDIIFDMQPGQLVSRALALTRDCRRMETMRRFALGLAASRNWGYIAAQYLKWINGEAPMTAINSLSISMRPQPCPAGQKVVL